MTKKELIYPQTKILYGKFLLEVRSMFFLNRKKRQQTTVDIEELNKKLDNKRSLTGIAAKICFFLAICMSIFHLYTSGFGMLPQMQHRAIHLAFALSLTFFIYPSSDKYREKVPWFDWVIIVFHWELVLI